MRDSRSTGIPVNPDRDPGKADALTHISSHDLKRRQNRIWNVVGLNSSVAFIC